METICDVCGSKEGIVGVAASALGPMSFSTCRSCYRANAEPYGVCVALFAMGPLEPGDWKIAIHPWARDVILSTLDRLHKTEEEFLRDIVQARKEHGGLSA